MNDLTDQLDARLAALRDALRRAEDQALALRGGIAELELLRENVAAAESPCNGAPWLPPGELLRIPPRWETPPGPDGTPPVAAQPPAIPEGA